MSAAEDRLDAIEARAIEFANVDDDDALALVAALRAVLDLHECEAWEDFEGNKSPECAVCIGADENALPYPCPTVVAIESALGGTP